MGGRSYFITSGAFGHGLMYSSVLQCTGVYSVYIVYSKGHWVLEEVKTNNPCSMTPLQRLGKRTFKKTNSTGHDFHLNT